MHENRGVLYPFSPLQIPIILVTTGEYANTSIVHMASTGTEFDGCMATYLNIRPCNSNLVEYAVLSNLDP